ncbi:MAG: ABC transporter ATP-binding protein/permease [Lachnospiraceae bacterium]|nr:ABC transporter ATP-binding protein [Lachnospiraceae bacterium]MCR5811711.1 ABC transporter ATP-binding protein/permease [Lachnospiraceae bacterium]
MKKDYSRSKLAIFASYIVPHRKAFAIDMALSVGIAAVDLLFPYVSRWSMRNLLPEGLFRTFFTVMLIMFAAYLIRAVCQYFVTVVGHRMGTLVEADMRRDVFSHMQELSYSFFDRNRTGVLLARVTNDLFEIVELAHHGPENILTCSLTIVGALIILLTINPLLTLVLVVMLPVCIIFSMRQRLNMQAANREVKKRTGEINAAIESGISGIRTSKAFANEAAEDQKFAAANEAFKASRISFYRAMGLFHAGIEATVSLMQVAVISFGGFLIMQDKLNYVDLITFTLYVSTFTSPIRKLVQFMEIYTQGMTGFDRFVELMRTQPEIQDSPNAKILTDVKGDIRFEDVSFSYNDGTQVLDHVDLHIAPGETVSLVGSSGGGKTTMCHLIPRFYDVTGGRVTVDGNDVRDLTQASLRGSIGIIQQDVFLFADTVMENIRYGRPDATDREVVEAAIRARIHEDILQMPDGYQTNVGERGVVLSGGQKQRISIARVFLKNPPILILDEATSALDSVTEKQIQESLDVLSKGKTCLVIAHRLSTVRDADRIAVVDGMHIIEQGSRDELLALGGAYAKLEKAQELA